HGATAACAKVRRIAVGGRSEGLAVVGRSRDINATVGLFALFPLRRVPDDIDVAALVGGDGGTAVDSVGDLALGVEGFVVVEMRIKQLHPGCNCFILISTT